jgi:predicted nucleic acid-binding protein
MPTRGRRTDALVDTSVAVALVLADHPSHEATRLAVGRRRLGLSGHAAFETFSVLTRLPPPARRTPASVVTLLATNFPATRHLPAETASDLLQRLASSAVSGGAVYDALVGATAKAYDAVLLTRDRRAAETYRALEVEFELLPSA